MEVKVGIFQKIWCSSDPQIGMKSIPVNFFQKVNLSDSEYYLLISKKLTNPKIF